MVRVILGSIWALKLKVGILERFWGVSFPVRTVGRRCLKRMLVDRLGLIQLGSVRLHGELI
ncbi:GL15952 [Drosophila persimilis]|uniref:GL15952 n=1 Tax=Drosophila persimilis TaxID=7234 RepID=B4ISC4_DROPE|nr:GL15952 [Drosophila persimilis]